MTRQRVLLRDALASTPGDLVHVVRRVHADAARPVLAHLLAVERAATANLRRVAAGHVAALANEHASTADRETPGRDEPGGRHEPISSPGPAQLLQQFETTRRETLCHLDDLPDDGWSRVVRHPALGTTRVITVVRRLLDHDLVHLGALADTRQEHQHPQRERTHG